MSKGSARDPLVPPAFLSIPDGYDPGRTLGPYVAAICTLAGFPPDPEQQLLLDVSFALGKDGRPLIFETVVVAPRQNFKTGFLQQRALGKLFILRRPLVVWSAHEFDTSRRALLGLEAMIEASPDLRREVRLTSRGQVATHGAVPEIKLKSGATLVFKTRTAGGGRGLTGDDLFVDEAYAVQPEQVGAVMPIMLARPRSQVDFASSACRPESGYLWELVQRGRAGGGPRMLYAEWCTPPPAQACDRGEDCSHERGTPGCGCDKPELIRGAHSAIERGRITLEKVTDLRRVMPPAEYGREVMGWHDEPIDGERPIPVDAFIELAKMARRPKDVEVVFFPDVSPGMRSASVGVAYRDGDRVRAELADHRPGTDWLVGRCVELNDRYPGARWALEGQGAVGALRPEFDITGIDVDVWTAGDMGRGCAHLQKLVAEAGFTYQPAEALAIAIGGAVKRDIGDGLWAWGRRKSTTDISPLVAVTGALWMLAQTETLPAIY